MSNETSIMKRRSFLMKAGCGLAGILAAGKCPATIIKKLIGNTGSMMSDSDSLGASAYITDGLVAMWDGEWNAGIGVHDANATVWKDLSGFDNDINLESNPYDGTYFFGRNKIVIDGAFATPDSYIVMSNRPNSPASQFLAHHTFEVCMKQIKNEPKNVNPGFGPYFSGISSCSNTFFVFVGNRLTGYWDVGGSRKIISPGPQLGSAFSLSIRHDDPDSSIVRFNDSISTISSGGWNMAIKTPVNFITFVSSNETSAKFEMMNIRLYSRALTQDEIAYNYLVDKVRFNI